MAVLNLYEWLDNCDPFQVLVAHAYQQVGQEKLQVGKMVFVAWIQSLRPGKRDWHWHAMQFVVEAGRDEFDVQKKPILGCLHVLRKRCAWRGSWVPLRLLRGLIFPVRARIGKETLHVDGIEGYRQFAKRVALMLTLYGFTHAGEGMVGVEDESSVELTCDTLVASTQDSAFSATYANAVERMLSHHMLHLEGVLRHQGAAQLELELDDIPEEEWLLLKEDHRIKVIAAEAKKELAEKAQRREKK